MVARSRQESPLDEVIAVVSGHWLRGSMTTTGCRVLDVLNENNTDFLRLTDAQVFSTSDLTTPITAFGEVMVPKDKLAVVFIPKNNNHDSDYKKYYSKVQTRRTASFALIGGHALTGSIHLKTRMTDPIYTINHALTRFFPMTQVDVAMPHGGSMPVAVAIANKQFVDCFHVGETEKSDQDSGAETTNGFPQISVMSDPLIRGLIDAAAGHADASDGDVVHPEGANPATIIPEKRTP